MRIVSFDHVLAGPYGTTILAELGADVIKVESSKGGMDPFRFFGTGEDPNLSPRFLEFNRNKRSFTSILNIPRDKESCTISLPRPMPCSTTTVSMSSSASALAMRSLRGQTGYHQFAHAGTRHHRAKRHFSTVGVNITAFTGLTYLWNHPGNTNPPIGSQTVFPDYVSGVLCAIIIISGVLYRDRQKKGAFIDLAQSEATAFMIGASLMEAAASGKDPEPCGNASPWAAPHDCYPCAGEDRWCVIAAENERAVGGIGENHWAAVSNGMPVSNC